jgi:GNAT superfamily N-acetyltransferase
MTATTHLNPTWLDSATYVDFLNQSFPGQWDARALAWYTQRSFNDKPCDLLVRTEGTAIVAGVTLCYRQVIFGGGPPLEICVLSAGATRPDLRGKGHYAALLLDALKRCRSNACVAALGFVTSDNASGRGLVRLGAQAVPTFYLTSPSPQLRRSASWKLQKRSSRELIPDSSRDVVAQTARRVHFHYARGQDWTDQFLRRRHRVSLLRKGPGCNALVEHANGTDRLQLLFCPESKRVSMIAALVANSREAQRKFFMFTLDSRLADDAQRLGLRRRNGYMLIQDTGFRSSVWRALTQASWEVHSGDRL